MIPLILVDPCKLKSFVHFIPNDCSKVLCDEKGVFLCMTLIQPRVAARNLQLLSFLWLLECFVWLYCIKHTHIYIYIYILQLLSFLWLLQCFVWLYCIKHTHIYIYIYIHIDMQPILEVFPCAMGSRPWFLLPVIPCKSKPGYRCPNWKWVDFPSTKNWVYHGSPTLDCTRLTIPSCSHMYIYIYKHMYVYMHRYYSYIHLSICLSIYM